jgi:hypothetical protein
VEGKTLRRYRIVNPTVRAWRCYAQCWSCGAEVGPQRATRHEAERPIQWSCPGCEVRWFAYAIRVELPTSLAC